MRIIRGRYRSKIINAPRSLPVRPTTDFAKEALFSILENFLEIEELEVLDLFAGTGNISYEFASRDCKRVDCVDSNLQCINFIQKTASTLGMNQIVVFRSDAFRFVQNCMSSYDLIFADPPYEMKDIEKLINLVLQSDVLKENGFFILEHSSRHSFEHHASFWQHRRYGEVNFSFFRQQPGLEKGDHV